jgi:hypothetical protein
MNQTKRQARAKARRKSMALVKRGVPHICSKWSLHGRDWLGKSDGLTPGQVMGIRDRAANEKRQRELG